MRPVWITASVLGLVVMATWTIVIKYLAPCLWAVGCAIRWQRGGQARWLYAAAVLATVGVLVKPMAVSVVLPLGVLAIARPGARPRQVGIAVGIAIGLTLLLVALMSPSGIWEQIVQYRVGARQGGSWDFRGNFKDVVQQPFRDQPGLYILAIVLVLLIWS